MHYNLFDAFSLFRGFSRSQLCTTNIQFEYTGVKGEDTWSLH